MENESYLFEEQMQAYVELCLEEYVDVEEKMVDISDFIKSES